MGYNCPKNAFLQLKHIQRIYLGLLSTTVKIKHISYAIFETISHFSRQNWPLFFLTQTLHSFNRNIPSKCKFSDFLQLELKFTKLFMSFFKQKASFSSKFGSLSLREKRPNTEFFLVCIFPHLD